MGTLGNFERVWSFLGRPAEGGFCEDPPSRGHKRVDGQGQLIEDAWNARRPSTNRAPRPPHCLISPQEHGRKKGWNSVEAARIDGNPAVSCSHTKQGLLPASLADRRKSIIQKMTISCRSNQNPLDPVRVADMSLQTMSESELRPSTSKRKQSKQERTRSRRTGYLSEPDKAFRTFSSSATLGASASKKKKLLSLLYDRFPSDRRSLKRLASQVPLSYTPQDCVVHVFVDLSNVSLLQAVALHVLKHSRSSSAFRRP